MTPEKKEELIGKLRGIVRNEIRITRVKTRAPLDVAASRMGGVPAVPPGFVWPQYTFKFSEYQGKAPNRSDEPVTVPLSFLAQINMKDVAELDEENLLPKTGVLCFFYELNTMQWGFDPKDKGCARVFYFPNESELTRAEYPDGLEEECHFPEYALAFKKHVSLPGEYEYDQYVDFENDEDDDEDENAYDECRVALGYDEAELDDENEEYITKLLGYPDVIQNPMEEECEYVSRGFYMGSGLPGLVPEERAKVEEAAKDWRLLFQMASVEEKDFDLMFDDVGSIYFWIKREDLLNCNFDNAWLLLQSY